MRVLLIVLLFAFVCAGCQMAKSQVHVSETAQPTLVATTRPDFDNEIKPILQARCQPCHFQGGKVYDKMPFDKPETITRLGTRLFTRIKDEKERTLIRQFLDQK